MGGPGGNCGMSLKEGQPSSDWTCPCGRGYWDDVKKQFITGGQVRERRVRSKSEYLAHLQSCERCKRKADRDGLIIFSEGVFLPRDDIPLSFVEKYVTEHLGTSASVRAGTKRISETDTPGYYIYSENRPPQSIITDLIYRAQLDQNTSPSLSRDGSPSLGQDRRRPSSDRQDRRRPSSDRQDRGQPVPPRRPEQGSQNRRSSSGQQYASFSLVSASNLDESPEEESPALMPYGSAIGEPQPDPAVYHQGSESPAYNSSTFSESPQYSYVSSSQGLGTPGSYSRDSGFLRPAHQTQSSLYTDYGSLGRDKTAMEQEGLVQEAGSRTSPSLTSEQSTVTTPSTTSSSVEWKYHGTYKRWFRDFEADGRSLRQYDNLNGPILPRATSATHQQVSGTQSLDSTLATPTTSNLGTQQVSGTRNLGSTFTSQPSQPAQARSQSYETNYRSISSGVENLALEPPAGEFSPQSQEPIQQRPSGEVRRRESREEPKSRGDRDRKYRNKKYRR